MDDLWGNAWSQPDTSTPSRGLTSEFTSKENTSSIALSPPSQAPTSWTIHEETSAWGEAPQSTEVWQPQSDNGVHSWSSAVPLPQKYEEYSASSVGAEGDIQVHSEPEEKEEIGTQDDDVLPSPNHSSIPSSASSDGLAKVEELNSDVAPPEDFDTFGTFESGSQVESKDPTQDSWTPADEPEMGGEADGWRAAWEESGDPGDRTATEIKEPEDEWAVAQAEAQRRHAYAPPELLALVRQNWDELAAVLWGPDSSSDASSKGFKTHEHRRSLELPPHLSALVHQKMVHPPIQFTRTRVARMMADSIKLTKHLPAVQLSPMSQLLASRGTSNWETSIRNKIEVVQDDVPVGWKVVEQPTETPQSKPADLEKKTGGMFSFWNRRSSTISRSSDKSSPPVKAESKIETKSDSPRPSTENITRTPTPIQDAPSSSPVKVEPMILKSLESPRSSSPASTSSPAPAPSLSAGSSAQSEQRPATPPVAAPSAVSRFFSRISRTSSSIRSSSSSPRNSIALSSEDVDFLSNVPSATEDTDDDLKELTQMLSSSSTGSVTTKLPPPLPPPPRAPAPISQLPSVHGTPQLSPTIASNYKPALPPLLPPPIISNSKSSIVKPLSPLSSQPSPTNTIPLTANMNSLTAAFIQPVSQANRPSQTPSSTDSRGLLNNSIFDEPFNSDVTKPKISSTSQPGDHQGSLFDDDDFTPFHASVAVSSSPVVNIADDKQELGDFGAFAGPTIQPFKSDTSFNVDDSFGDFLSPVDQTSVPPPLPSKPSTPIKTTRHERTASKVSVEQHQMTINLMERAAARPGRWPALPSPVPPLLRPPPSTSRQSNGSLFDDDDVPESLPVANTSSIQLMPISQIQLKKSSKPLRSSTLSPPPPPPPASHSLLDLDTPFTQSSSFSSSSSAIPKPPPSTLAPNTSSQSGLSAQDLSFFEGL